MAQSAVRRAQVDPLSCAAPQVLRELEHNYDGRGADLLVSGGCFNPWGIGYGEWMAAAVAVIAALDLVVGTARKARLHDDLARRFIMIEKAMVLVEEPDAALVRKYTAERLEIEADEPPVYRVLDVLCRNELMRAMGYKPDQLSPVSRPQRLLAHFVDWQGHKLRDVSAA